MSNSYSKLAAIGILLFMLFSAWFLLGVPYKALWEDKIAQADRLQRKQHALSLLIADKERYEHEYQAFSENSELQQIFLNDKTGALAEAKLQGIVKHIVGKSGARLQQAVIVKTGSKKQNDRSKENGNDKTVTVKVLMQGSIKAIYTALQELENSRPLILVSNLDISFTKLRYQISGSSNQSSYRASYDATAFIL